MRSDHWIPSYGVAFLKIDTSVCSSNFYPFFTKLDKDVCDIKACDIKGCDKFDNKRYRTSRTRDMALELIKFNTSDHQRVICVWMTMLENTSVHDLYLWDALMYFQFREGGLAINN